MKIAIIMATYNGEKFLGEQIDSICRNTVQDWKLYLFDDGSTDGTILAAESYAARYPGKIQIHRNEKNLRSAGNFYCGARFVYEREPADYYMFCDQDDRWDADKIEVTLKKMQELEQESASVSRRHTQPFGKEPAVGERAGASDIPLLVYTDSRMTDQEGHEICPSFQAASHLNSENCDFAHLLMENKMPGCTQMMNHALLTAAFSHPGIPEHFIMHDWWLGLVAACFGRIGYLNRATMGYRQHGGNVVGGQSFVSYVKERISGIGRLREMLRADVRQGAEFYEWYGGQMREPERQTAEAFAELEKAGFFRKKALLCRYHFWKSGFVRNVALFLLL